MLSFSSLYFLIFIYFYRVGKFIGRKKKRQRVTHLSRGDVGDVLGQHRHLFLFLSHKLDYRPQKLERAW